MDNPSGTDSAMDLSLRNSVSSSPASSSTSTVSIIKPIPRPPWSIVWYRNLWSLSDHSFAKNEKLSESKNKSVNSTCTSASFSSPLSTVNCLRTNATDEGRADSYNFPLSQYLQNQTNSHNVGMAMGHCATASSSHFVHHSYRNRASFQEAQIDNHPPRLDDTGSVANERRQDCSYDTIISVEDDDLGNESENSENIVVTTITTDDAADAENSLSSQQKGSSGNLTGHSQNSVILDVACCDGPVQFKRVSNPNFAVTVEHNEVCTFPSVSGAPESESDYSAISLRQTKFGRIDSKRRSSTSCSGNVQMYDGKESSCGGVGGGGGGITTLKSYLCIYCNQSFKSLFCYQKHKKRHLNPVSVDITTTMENSTSQPRPSNSGTGSTTTTNTTRSSREGVVRTCGSNNNNNNSSKGNNAVGKSNGGGGVFGITPDNNNTKAKTKDLNVQFFPCKKCGSKFPSYYFVHKHRKICH